MLLPEMASAMTMSDVKPLLIAVQFVPLSVERKTPAHVPAKRFVPETVRALIILPFDVKPTVAAVQVAPLLVER
jgi:hypothetical protein